MDCMRNWTGAVPGAISLLKFHFTMQLNTAVKYTYIIKPKKTSFKNVVAISVFTVNPPCEIDNLLLKYALKKSNILLACSPFFYVIHLQCSPCMYRRIYITKVPFISRQLTIRFHIPFPHNQNKLMFCKRRVNHSHGDCMKGEIPCGIPRVFPFVGH